MKCQVYRTCDSIFALKESWQGLYAKNEEKDLYRSYEWHEAILLSDLGRENPLLFVACYDNSVMVGIAPFCIVERKRYLFTIRSLEFIGKPYAPLAGYIAAKGREEEIGRNIACFVADELGDEWDRVLFENLSKNDLAVQRLTESLSAHIRFLELEDDTKNIRVALSCYTSVKNYWAGLHRKMRTAIRRGFNQLDKRGVYKVVCYKDDTCLENGISDYYEVYKQCWKEDEADPTLHKILGQYFGKRGELRLYLLYFLPQNTEHQKNDTEIALSENSKVTTSAAITKGMIPIATKFHIVWQNTVFMLKTAYNEDYYDYDVGNVLLWCALRHSLEEDGIAWGDFQRGTEQYKYRFGGNIYEERYSLTAINGNRWWLIVLYWMLGILKRLGTNVCRLVQKVRIAERLVKSVAV